MNQTITLPQNLVSDIDALKQHLGFGDVEATTTYLLQTAIERERKLLVARYYQNRQKTMRQCAEMLNVDLEEMMDILRELGISFGHDDLPQQLETAKKLAQQMRSEREQHVESR
jgi:energy-converting hydrogenase A subunit M